MSFETKQEAKMIVGETEFYLFDFGGLVGKEYYTTSRKRVTWTPIGWPSPPGGGDIVWLPLPISRGEIKTQTDIESSKPKLTMPCRPSFVDLLKDGGLDALQVIIIRGFGKDYDEDYRAPFFSGYLTDLNIETKKVTGTLESIEEVFETLLPRLVYQPYCNNTLYDETCGKPFEFKYATVLSMSNGNRKLILDLSASGSDIGLSPAIDDYTLGRVWKRVEISPGVPDPSDPRSFRECLYSSDNLGDDTMEIHTHAPILELGVGDKVNLTLGCDNSVEICILKHANRLKFTGMANVPGIQPITEGF